MEEGNWGKQQNPESLMPDSALCAEHRVNTAINIERVAWLWQRAHIPNLDYHYIYIFI